MVGRMKRYAEILDGKVVHIGSHAIQPQFSPDSGLIVIEVTNPVVEEGWLFDGADFTEPPANPPAVELTVATITTYEAPPPDQEPLPDVEKTEFQVGELVIFRVRIAGVNDRDIAVPLDRLDAEGNILERSAVWLKLRFENGISSGGAVFERSGRYGVGPHTSSEFVVPEHSITIFAQ